VAPREWLVLHKPAGRAHHARRSRGRPTVFDLLPDRPGLTYVGRLDYMTAGVLLFTTDGDAAHRLTHPSREVERTYVAVVRGNAPAAVRTLRHGLTLDDGPVEATAVDARPLGNRRWEFELTIAEGRTARCAASARRSTSWSSVCARCASARAARPAAERRVAAAQRLGAARHRRHDRVGVAARSAARATSCAPSAGDGRPARDRDRRGPGRRKPKAARATCAAPRPRARDERRRGANLARRGGYPQADGPLDPRASRPRARPRAPQPAARTNPSTRQWTRGGR
jgi:pseudouridine synthase